MDIRELVDGNMARDIFAELLGGLAKPRVNKNAMESVGEFDLDITWVALNAWCPSAGQPHLMLTSPSPGPLSSSRLCA